MLSNNIQSKRANKSTELNCNLPRAPLQGRSQSKRLAVPQESTEEQTLAGPIRTDAADAANRFVDLGEHVHPGVGDDDQLLVVVWISAVFSTIVIMFGRGGNIGNGVGFGVVLDVAREEEGEGPVGAAGEAVDDLVVVGVISGRSLRRCVGHLSSMNQRQDTDGTL